MGCDLYVTYRSESGRGDWIRTSDPLRPRQVRYQAALRPDSKNSAILRHFRTARSQTLSPLLAITVPKLSQNMSTYPLCVRTPLDSFADRLSFSSASRFICNFILRVLLEHLGVTLSQELCCLLMGW